MAKSRRNITRLIRQIVDKAWRFADRAMWGEAVNCIEQAIQLRPKAPLYWVLKGHFLRESLRCTESEAAIRRALVLDSGFDPAWSELGRLYRDAGEYLEAADCFRRSVSIRPDFNVYTLLANAELTFDPQAALASATAALSLNPDWDEAIRIRDSAKRAIAAKRKSLQKTRPSSQRNKSKKPTNGLSNRKRGRIKKTPTAEHRKSK